MKLTLEDMHTILQRLEYPATREDLIDMAARTQAPQEAIDRLRTLPEYRYGSVDSVMDALRGLE
ncbi:MAG: DUF2795 domain-containing protein [Armatimonadota bacterium]